MSYDYQASPESYFATRLDEENDLDRCMNESPHVVTFWNAVCAFINHEREHGENPDRVLECPSWGQWRSIGQHFAAGRKVEAIRRLIASTCAWTQDQPALPANVTNGKWRAFMAANALPSWDHRGGLTLSEAKSIIDTLEHVPQWFGNDTNRVFNSPYVTCAEPTTKVDLNVPYDFTVDPREDAPKSLGDLLREKISTMREKVASEEPEKPEHSLWLNVYPEEPGYCRAAASGSRAEADQYADSSRIACINITYKKGEGL